MRKIWVLTAVTAIASIFTSLALSAECGMSDAFTQTNANSRTGKTKVLTDNRNLLFKVPLNVNTDGTSRSYSVDDFWGETKALNNLCNAMSDACQSLNSTQKRQRRLATQAAHQAGWPSAMLAQTKILSSVIPFKDGKPCPDVNGYLISSTTLSDQSIADSCNIKKYVDALVTPALVLPRNPPNGQTGFSARNAKIGDLVVAMVPGTQKPVYGVVGDNGPRNRLGEASIAMNGKLLGKTHEPENYHEVRGWVVPSAVVLIFSNTRNAETPYLRPEKINEDAAELFATWGGPERLNTCANQ